MPDFAKISKALTYLREEIPAEDISKDSVFKHPHNTTRLIPERLPPAKVRELSRLQPARAILTTLGKWGLIAAAIAICTSFWHPVLYVLGVLVIGSCQHALLILGHDASHFRTLSVRWQNDLFANFFMMWPTFASVEGFRKFHSTHHQYTNLPNDGNRHIWYTHDAAGDLAPDWQFPKTRLGLAWILLRRAALLTGLFWILRGLVGSTFVRSPGWMRVARLGFYTFSAATITFFPRLAGVSALLDRAVLHLAHRGSVHPTDLRAQRGGERPGRVFDHPHDDPDLAGGYLYPAVQCWLPPRASLVSKRPVLPAAAAAPGAVGAPGLS